MEWTREAAVDRVERLVETVETERMPVPVRELWVLGDLALGLDPVERLDVYLTKDVLLEREPEEAAAFRESHGVEGIGQTVRADWARENPSLLRTNANGYAAPERCLAAHLLEADEPIHLEVCNSGFEDNVTQRVRGAQARAAYEEVLDPRGVCLWVDGQRSTTAFEKLHTGELVFPTLPEALQQLGLEPAEAETAAEAVSRYRKTRDGPSVRGDVV